MKREFLIVFRSLFKGVKIYSCFFSFLLNTGFYFYYFWIILNNLGTGYENRRDMFYGYGRSFKMGFGSGS